MNRVVKGVIFGVAVAAMLAGTYYGMKWARQKSHPPPAAPRDSAMPIRTAVVGRTNLADVITLTGALEAVLRVELRPKNSGRLARLADADGKPIFEGSRVAAGQVVAELDRRDLDAQVEASRAAVATAKAALESAVVNRTDKAREQARMKRLFDQGSTTEQQRDFAVSDFDRASAGVNQAEAQVRQAEAALAVNEVALSEAFVRAPMDGVVSFKGVDPGAMVNSGTTIVGILPLEELKFLVAVPGSYLPQIEAGKTRVDVRADAAPGVVFPGVVAHVHPVVDSVTRTATIEVRLPNAKNARGEWLLRPGLYAEGRLILGERRDVVAVPFDVLLRRGMRYLGFVVNGDHAETREIVPGVREGRMVEALSGLVAGEELVISGQHRLSDGVRVNRTGGGE
jgi:RND family efflux transporter MFP subunit